MQSNEVCDYCKKNGDKIACFDCDYYDCFEGIELIPPKVVEQLTWEVEMLQDQLELCEERLLEE